MFVVKYVLCQECFVSNTETSCGHSMFAEMFAETTLTDVRRNHLYVLCQVCFVSSMFCVKYGATNNQYQHGMPANEYNYITQRHQECDHQKLWRSRTSAGVHLAHHARSSSTSVLAAIRTTGHLRSGLRRRQVAASRGARQFCVEHTGCRANQASKQ